MRSKELDAALTSLKRVPQSLASRSVHVERLDRSIRELAALRKGGKIPARRVTRIIGQTCEVICDLVLDPSER